MTQIITPPKVPEIEPKPDDVRIISIASSTIPVQEELTHKLQMVLKIFGLGDDERCYGYDGPSEKWYLQR